MQLPFTDIGMSAHKRSVLKIVSYKKTNPEEGVAVTKKRLAY